MPDDTPPYLDAGTAARLLSHRVPVHIDMADKPSVTTVAIGKGGAFYPLVVHAPPNSEALQRLMRESAARVDAAFRLPPGAIPSPFMQTSIAEATAKVQVAMRRLTERFREVNGAMFRAHPYWRKLSAAYAQVRAEERRKRDREARRTMSRRAYRRWRGRQRGAGRC